MPITMNVPKTPYTGLRPPAPFFLPVCVAEAAVKVVVLNPTPLGPMLIVWPLKTSVVGLAPGPKVNVDPPITTNEDPTSEKVTPPAVTA